MLDVKTIKELLHKRELKATNSRIALLSNLVKFGSAMPYSAIQKALKSTDRVTLYRTLQTLSDKGIIHKAANINNEDYYAICNHTCSNDDHIHNHIHFKCDDCHTITCENIEQEIYLSIPNFKINSVSINANGKCKDCAENQTVSPTVVICSECKKEKLLQLQHNLAPLHSGHFPPRIFSGSH